MFNWREEALRFLPHLRILDHTGPSRLRSTDHFADFDLILTTYGTLRSDIVFLKDYRFDYAILDEAQAIKNAQTESAKAVRLLQADHRLALSGTPVQNHLGELWSLFEYLNPGMLGAAAVFDARFHPLRPAPRPPSKPDDAPVEPRGSPRCRGRAPLESPPPRTMNPTNRPGNCSRRACAPSSSAAPRNRSPRTFRPAPNKPSTANSMTPSAPCTTNCATTTARTSSPAATAGATTACRCSKPSRLRQAACHPGLIDKTRIGEPSAKLDTLFTQIDEILEEHHKALVFSQFTSLLAIVRQRLDHPAAPASPPSATPTSTAKPATANPPSSNSRTTRRTQLFLISLKAGGLGLNLTGADYVFLLDPWWNPAVEAQAIDRAHRIGQTRHVFAYRLIAKDTVEEKVLQLQQTKRDLADAIISEDNAILSNLTSDDLAILLS